MARILVIDDDSDTRAMLQTLKPAGYEVISAADGREGVMRHRTSPAELVITNLYMPNEPCYFSGDELVLIVRFRRSAAQWRTDRMCQTLLHS
jgi:CheY-like chemotaxis protein